MSQLSPEELVAQLKSITSNPPQSLTSNPELRNKLYHAAREAMLSFEENPNPISRIAVAQQAEWVALRTCCEMALFPALAESDTPKTLEQLVETTKADPTLLARFIRAGINFGSIKEVDSQHYVLASSHALLGDPKVADALPKFEESISEVTNIVSADFVHGTFYATPQLLQQTGYRNPEDPLNTAMQLAFNAPGKAPYEIFVSKPESAKAIGMILNAMGIPPSQQVQYTYPLQQELVDGFDKSESDAFLVDIGAGNAHVVSALRKAMPHIPGRLVAQDLAPVIASAPALAEPDEKQAHDFFTEQPIKHARAYYMRLCLHNWRDEPTRQILVRIREAMKPEYSRLLIHEMVIPALGSGSNDGATGGGHRRNVWAAVSDINQMGACASFERTEAEWAELLGEVGLEFKKVWYPQDPAAAAVIEARLRAVD
ncbi:MAG: hypothetical protein Q9190_005720 [Brigantiaea leucoxantha]